MVAQAVRAPCGEVVGALEVVWEGERTIEQAPREALVRAAGMATVLAFVDQSDGHATLDSTVDVGTRICLFLPTGDAEVARVPVGVDVPVMGVRIVLVDPGERTRRVIHAMLTGVGYRVTAVSSGEAALDVLRAQGGDLLVTELALPGVPGTRLIDAVGERFPGVRCVALASVDQPRTLEGTPVLVKPFSHTRLLRTVGRVVGRD